MSASSDWYRDPAALTAALQRTRPGSPRIAGYDVLFEIGRGGQGAVYAATQHSTRRRVAIKVLDQRAHDEARRARFQREIELAAGLRHAHIVSVFDSTVTDDQHPCLVMECIEGSPLHEYAARSLESPPRSEDAIRRILRLMSAICDAVHYAHQRGVIHRDLKPSNILIDAAGEPHVLDFGVARAVGSDAVAITHASSFLGTLAYASPEQVAGQPHHVDTRSDIYALGVVLYELLTGRPPYSSSGPIADTVRSITETIPEHPSRLLAIPGSFYRRMQAGVDAVALKALAKDVEQRYQSADAMARDLDRLLTGEPVDARPESAASVLGRFIRRHRVTAALGAALLLTVVGFAVMMSVLYGQARTEADKAAQIRVFLEDTLASVEPNAPGQDVTVREVLDEAVHWIDVSLAGQPEAEAAVRATIGNSFRAVGELDRAALQLNGAMEIRRDLFGDDHLEVAQSHGLLGLLYRDRGELGEAERQFRECLAIRRRLLGDDHPDVAMASSNLALLLKRTGRADDAESLLGDALRIRRMHFGETHPDTAMTMFLLAELAASRGQLEEALDLHRAALAVRRAALHASHPDIDRSLFATGVTLARLGRAAEAEAILDESLNFRRARYASGHPAIAEVEQWLAQSRRSRETQAGSR